MWKHELGVAAFLLLLGLSAAVQASRLRLGEFGQPGPGLFPFILAVALCLVSFGLLLRVQAAGRNSPGQSAPSLPPGSRRKVLGSFLALGGYAIALEPLGFAGATFLFLLFLYKAIEPMRWRPAIGGSLIATFLTYTLFQLLRVPLPPGVWMR